MSIVIESEGVVNSVLKDFCTELKEELHPGKKYPVHTNDGKGVNLTIPFHVFSEIHRRYARFPLEELPERRLVGKVEGDGYLLYG